MFRLQTGLDALGRLFKSEFAGILKSDLLIKNIPEIFFSVEKR